MKIYKTHKLVAWGQDNLAKKNTDYINEQAKDKWELVAITTPGWGLRMLMYIVMVKEE